MLRAVGRGSNCQISSREILDSDSIRNHNQLRITRIIECLRLLVSDDEADDFKSKTLELLEEGNEVNEVTLGFWRNA